MTILDAKGTSGWTDYHVQAMVFFLRSITFACVHGPLGRKFLDYALMRFSVGVARKWPGTARRVVRFPIGGTVESKKKYDSNLYQLKDRTGRHPQGLGKQDME